MVSDNAKPIREVELAADGGAIAASVIELGAAVRDLKVRTRHGLMQRVVLGLAAVEDYVKHSPHMGAICGRFANRIRGGRFTLDGKVYQLPLNQDPGGLANDPEAFLPECLDRGGLARAWAPGDHVLF